MRNFSIRTTEFGYSVAESNTVPTVVASWNGNSAKTTETFHMPSNQWKITWNTNSGRYGDMNFIIEVYNADGSVKDTAANAIGASNDYTIERGAGDYYLKINTAQPYDIEIQA